MGVFRECVALTKILCQLFCGGQEYYKKDIGQSAEDSVQTGFGLPGDRIFRNKAFAILRVLHIST